jgi:hypothetical protein
MSNAKLSKLLDIRPQTQKVILHRGGEKHEVELMYDLNAMAELELKYGSQEVAFEKMLTGSMEAIKFVLWAGMLHYDEQYQETGEATFTVHQVGRMFLPADLTNIAADLVGAVNSATPEVKEKPKKTRATATRRNH